ncbi:MAG TPA: hypothetical protein VGR81_13355 [Candidatus Acidoferrales bacterium]|nr:hypothetical protein [Candidatus Acidoferrales bacterium]
MSKADILEKLKQHGEAAEIVRAYWAETLPGIGQLPEPQLQSWLIRFELDAIVGGLDAAVNQRSKLDAKGEPMTAPAAVSFASAVINRLHLEGLPEAEREEIKAHREHIRSVRSAAGKLGRAKQLAEEVEACREVAQVCPDLPEVARPLPNAYGFGFEVGFASASATEHAAAPEAKPAAAAPPAAQTEEKDNSKTKNRKPKNCKQCGAALSRDKSHLCENPPAVSSLEAGRGKTKTNPDRYTRYEGCECYAQIEELDYHADTCPLAEKTKAVAKPSDPGRYEGCNCIAECEGSDNHDDLCPLFKAQAKAASARSLSEVDTL